MKSSGFYMRVIHRYLGFFLAGILAVYALSGIVMVFRNTDAFKRVKQVERQLEANINADELGDKLRMKRLKVTKQEGDIIHFGTGTYNSATGLVKYTEKKLPFFLGKMTKMHKATTDSPLFWLNIFFGISLLFFVISSFWMFKIKTATFKKGLYFTIGGIVLALIVLFV